MVLMDSHCNDWDEKLASFVLKRACERPYDPDSAPQPSASSQKPSQRENTEALEADDDDSLWPVDRMRVYLEMIKSRKAKGPPPIAPAATALLERYFNWQRENRSKLNQSRCTIRMLESLIRLAQAHSLLLGKEEVTLEDAVVSVSLMDMTCGEAASTSGPPPLKSLASEVCIFLFAQKLISNTMWQCVGVHPCIHNYV